MILGADGYLGWPTAMYFSQRGHDVVAVDNYLRRRLCLEHDLEPLFSVPNLAIRTKLWQKTTGNTIEFAIGDCCDYGFVSDLFERFKPDVVVHYAEQPSAPYSMIDYSAARLTVSNNLLATLNLVWAVRQFAPDCHIIKLGTMGEYGTPDIDIEEGWIDIAHKGRKDRFLFPRQASSLYHTTKIQDTDMLWFYVRTWGIKVTDLMQGPVYGIETDETKIGDGLDTCFNYDEIFGTVLNRFIVQAAAGHPLTVYGKGGQTRGYLNIKDTLACVALSALNPPAEGEFHVFNQVTETFSVNELAEKVQRVGRTLGLKVQIKQIENPRKEKEEHYYNPTYTGLQDLGLKPNYLTEDVLAGMMETVIRHQDGILPERIFRGIKW